MVLRYVSTQQAESRPFHAKPFSLNDTPLNPYVLIILSAHSFLAADRTWKKLEVAASLKVFLGLQNEIKFVMETCKLG